MTRRYRKFVAEPMGNKPVIALAGIGPVLAKRLKKRRFGEVLIRNNITAYTVFGQYLVLKKNEDMNVLCEHETM
uniref:Uncharacterized protein n=1 Tax=Glossina morsitans morsitans TaxID=37546 RepID=A0A1B0G0J2_GLOMM